MINVILQNRVYTGELIQGKKKVENYRTHKLINANKDEWIITENHHEPIISKEKFDEVQGILNKNKSARSNKEKDLFYSFLKCADCGSSFTLRKVKKYEYYHCTSYVRNGSCTSHSIRKDKLVGLVIEELNKKFKRNKINVLTRDILLKNINSIIIFQNGELNIKFKQRSLIMKQNIYDDEKFFNQYEELRNEQKDKNANDLIEIPNFRKLMPDVTNKCILDLGCGYGENDKFYKELGAKYVLGTDISEKMIERANENNKIDGIEYKVIAMEDVLSINKKFDIIISSLAFHYIKDFDKLINDCYKLLNKDGYLVFSQEHPFTTCIKFTENVKKGHTIIDNKYFGLFSDYNRPRRENKRMVWRKCNKIS